jgi:hypothetical protein
MSEHKIAAVAAAPGEGLSKAGYVSTASLGGFHRPVLDAVCSPSHAAHVAAAENVVCFRRRSSRKPIPANAFHKSTHSIGKTQAIDEGDESYRERMIVNFMAAGAVALLVIAGDWIFNTLATVH